MTLFHFFGSLFTPRRESPPAVPAAVCLAAGCARERGTFLPLCFWHWHVIHPRMRKRFIHAALWFPGSPAYRSAVNAAVQAAELSDRRGGCAITAYSTQLAGDPCAVSYFQS